jgi:hypothetical protein
LRRRPDKVHLHCSSGFYAWRLNLESKRAKEDRRLSVPVGASALGPAPVDAFQKHRELGLRPDEATALEPFARQA